MPLNASAPQLTKPIGPEDHTTGSASASVTLLEYGDFQCPSCGQAFVVLERVRAKLGDKVRFAYRHFPLAKVHPLARAAAEASEAAASQGKFWEMHQILYRHQKQLEPKGLRRYGQEIGLDMQRFDADIAAHTFAARVQDDLTSGVRSGVNGTPTFFVNGVRYSGSYDEANLIATLQSDAAA